MDDERCDHIVKIASDKLGPSGLAYRLNDDPTKSRYCNPESHARNKCAGKCFICRAMVHDVHEVHRELLKDVARNRQPACSRSDSLILLSGPAILCLEEPSLKA